MMLALWARRRSADNPRDVDDNEKSNEAADPTPPKRTKGTGGRKKKADMDVSVPISSSTIMEGGQLDPSIDESDVSGIIASAEEPVRRVDASIGAMDDTAAVGPSLKATATTPSDGAKKKAGATKKGKKDKVVDNPSLGVNPTTSVLGGTSAGSGLQSLMLGGGDFDFSADSIDGLLPNLDDNLAELEANLGVLSDEFRLDDGPLSLSSIPGLDGDLLDRLRFDDKDDAASIMDGMEELTESQLQDALMELDGNEDFDLDKLMRMSSVDTADSTDPLLQGIGGKGKKKKTAAASGRQKDSKAKTASSSVKNRDGLEESDDAGIPMGYASDTDEEDDLMLDVIMPNENHFELSDEDEDEEEDAATATASIGDDLNDGSPLGRASDHLGDDGDQLSSDRPKESQSSSEPSSKNILRKTGKVKSAKVSDIDDLSGEGLELGIVDPPPLEEFRRLMESLGPDSLFEDDTLFGDDDSAIFAGTSSDDSEYYTYEGSKKKAAKKRTVLDGEDADDTSLSSSGPADDSDPLLDEDEEEFDMDMAGFGADDKVRFSTATAKRATGIGRVYKSILDEDDEGIVESTENEKVWLPRVYEGGDPFLDNSLKERDPDLQAYLDAHDDPCPWRAQVVAVVTNSSRNTTALEYVHKVFDYIKEGTGHDDRIVYQILSFSQIDDEPFEELDGMIQMWLESYNTYHLIDGLAMREAWGAIMPHIILSEKNLQAILAQVKWALNEDALDGALLTPRLRTVRFRGGAQEMSTGYNTETLDSEFSVVSVR